MENFVNKNKLTKNLMSLRRIKHEASKSGGWFQFRYSKELRTETKL